MQQASNETARTMRQNQDPRWQNSQFLKFMNQVGSGEVQIDEEKNEVVGAVKTEGALEGAWGDTLDSRSIFDASSQQDVNLSASAMERAFAETATTPVGMEGAWKEARTANATGLHEAWGDSKVDEDKVMASAWADSDNLVRELYFYRIDECSRCNGISVN